MNRQTDELTNRLKKLSIKRTDGQTDRWANIQTFKKQMENRHRDKQTNGETERYEKDKCTNKLK